MELKPLTPEDYSTYKRYFINQPYHLCVYSLSSIIAWQNSVYQALGGVFKNTLHCSGISETQIKTPSDITPCTCREVYTGAVGPNSR